MSVFIETSVTRTITATINSARSFRTNATIIGAPGVGKTEALKNYAKNNPQTALITVTPILGGSLRALFTEMCEATGLYNDGSVQDLERRLLRLDPPTHHHKFYDRYDREYTPKKDWHLNPVIILDESQNLPLKSFREILHISREDDGKLCFVFCGNREVLKRVNADEGAISQISRRVQFREEVNTITPEDADLLASAYGVEGMDAFALIRRVAEKYHADGVARVLRMARSQTDAKTIRASHIRQATSILPQYRI